MGGDKEGGGIIIVRASFYQSMYMKIWYNIQVIIFWLLNYLFNSDMNMIAFFYSLYILPVMTFEVIIVKDSL